MNKFVSCGFVVEGRNPQMELPDDVLRIIREYSRPIGTRTDWRTCKRQESGRIKMSNRALLLWYKWMIGPKLMFKEIEDWTFYGRRHLIKESRQRFWTQEVITEIPQTGDPEWYEKRYLLEQEHPLMATGYIEHHMLHVSLIV